MAYRTFSVKDLFFLNCEKGNDMEGQHQSPFELVSTNIPLALLMRFLKWMWFLLCDLDLTYQ